MVLLIGCSTMVFGLIRGSMSMAIVCMVDQTAGLLSDEINLNGSNLLSDDVQNNVQMYTTTYQVNWSVDEQAKIHTSYYIGALVAVFAADNLIRRFGAKHVLSFGLILNILGSFSTPVIAIHFSYIFVIALRSLIGFGSGFLIPCGSVIISRWFPVAEKSTAMAIFTTGIVYIIFEICIRELFILIFIRPTGNQIGIAGAMILTAKICQINVLGGWPLSFTLYGMIVIHFQGYPLNKILLSPCVLAICVCSFAQSFVLVGLITYLPRYNQLALQMNISSNGIWSAIPFFVQMITKLFCGAIADFIKKQRVSATIVTKVFNGIASFGTAGCIVLISMLHSDTSLLVTILMCSSMGFFSGYVSGYNTSIVSVAPQFTAFISSYSQIYAKAASTLAPFLMGLMTQKGTIEEFYILRSKML
uniref:MFS domain-containing protein n=1 Tax=Heterorhabditis bacteriophora TaxID=37862 RepID=A0A1I7WNH3_HETBA